MSLKWKYLYRAYRYRWRDDWAELRFMCQNLSRGQVAVDLGTYKGAYTYWMRQRVGPSGTVYAFEPQPCQVQYLRGVFSAMHYDNVEAVPLAVSDRCGPRQLHVPAGLGKSHMASLENVGAIREMGETHSVDTTTLDAFFENHSRGPDFLKIDVEGHELAVLNGGLRTLEDHRPTILLECEGRHRSNGGVWPVLNLLQSLGYEGSFFLNRRRLPLAKFNPDVHQRLETLDPVFLPPGYVNNFAFVPQD